MKYRSLASPPSLLALSIAVASLAGTARAAVWQINDDWSLSSNSTLSLGTSWSLQSADKQQLTRADAASIGKVGTGSNYNTDDGKLNFDKGDIISTVFKGLTEFDLNDGNQGAFIRFKYWYDHQLETTDGDFRKFNDSGWQDLARFKGFEALDAYVWKSFDLDGHALNAKLGKQVLSWGEALFLQNGINAINPLDVSAFNRPGVELKEGQLPVEMFSFSLDLTDAMSLEGFWQYNFRPSVLDGCGTFFSTGDNNQEGCQFRTVIAGANGTTDQAVAAGRIIPRGQTQWASDTGQYGLAMHYVFEELNSTDLGLYYANYHSRTPVANGTIATGGLPTARYFTAYPEDIRMFGVSLSSVLGTTALFSELSYRPNQPVGFNSGDTFAVLAGQTNSPVLQVSDITPYRGTELQGYARLPVWQFSLGATDTVDNILGANRFSWAAEAGANWVDDIDGQRLGRASAFGRTPPTDGAACVTGGGGMDANQSAALNDLGCNTKGLVDHFSWGYRARLALAYEGVLPAITVTPALTWRHDVDGYGPNFQEGQQAAGLSLTFDYRNNYSLELAYNAFFGSNDFSTLDDRDFASVTAKASF
ncbi:DUF1302 domain-containing protein [Pseudomonas sp. H9]|uniref:DUF1302 domain-containing protein n=1 Tax=Pseudomonas sp. H9 TaxID=483968 RepID=UPI001057F39C|nr:DUF1302 domain-containing protein [Pseudomonas sp. H9]TDF83806.1 DUF1302 domain-containing protein [Pseudomonas sp. H9]